MVKGATMEHFKNILFLSLPGVKQQFALRRACALAQRNNARLTVLTVVREPSMNPFLLEAGLDPDALSAAIIKEEHARSDALVAKVCDRGPAVVIKVYQGRPFIEAIREVLRANHDLVVLAAGEKPGLITRIFGSTHMHLMRKCPCPVWVVKPGNKKGYKRILAAVDTTHGPWDDAAQSINPQIISLASSLAAMDDARLDVLQAWSVPNDGYLEVRGGMSDRAVRRLRDEARDDYARRVEHLLDGVHAAAGGRLHTHLERSDDPAAAIVKFVRKEKIDLLVMGTVSRTGLAGFFIGNTAEAVLGAVDCSVLTLKPAGFVSPVTLPAD
jgi:nucleotide-binding universal stress UspA family protein